MSPEDKIMLMLDLIEANINKPIPFLGLLSVTIQQRNLCQENTN